MFKSIRGLWREYRHYKQFRETKHNSSEYIEYLNFNQYREKKDSDLSYQKFIKSLSSNEYAKREYKRDSLAFVSQKMLSVGDLTHGINEGEEFLKRTELISAEIENAIMRRILLSNNGIGVYEAFLLGKDIMRTAVELMKAELKLKHKAKKS